jgi:hypothetical protein
VTYLLYEIRLNDISDVIRFYILPECKIGVAVDDHSFALLNSKATFKVE